MSKADWVQTGTGGAAIISESGSNRLQLTLSKLLLWNGRSNMADSQIVADIKLYSNAGYCFGGLILRSDATQSNCFRLKINSTRSYTIERVVSGVVTNLGMADSTQSWNIYVKTRFTILGNQLSIEEYIAGQWVRVACVDDMLHFPTSGYAGIWSANTSAAHTVFFDNVEIRESV